MQTRRLKDIPALRILAREPRSTRVVVARLGVVQARLGVFEISGEPDRLLVGVREFGVGAVRVWCYDAAARRLLRENRAPRVVARARADGALLGQQRDRGVERVEQVVAVALGAAGFGAADQWVAP